MKTKLILTSLAIFMAALAINGCNTWDGAGKDVERAGEKMQRD